MTDAPLFAGVELGGTKCVCVLASGPSDVRDEVRITTRGPQETLSAIDAVLSGWHRQHGFHGLGFASFGPVDLEQRSATFGYLIGTPKRAWDRVSLVNRARSFAVPVGFDTDVNAAALAEGLWGAARGLNSYVYLTVGSGVGVGSIVEGRPVRGLGHSEAGHLRVPRLQGDSWPGNCPFHGDCVEGLACGPAIQARTGLMPADLPADHPAWDAVAHALAALCHNLALTVAPERIVAGGGVVVGQPQLLPRVRRALSASLGGYAHAARIAQGPAEFLSLPMLGERSGALGAIALARDALRSSEGRPDAPP